MWHASVSPHQAALAVAMPEAWSIAARALRHVGDASLGEWREVGEIAVHLRRRLTPRECALAGGLEVVDVRGTEEQARRVDRMRLYLPAALRERPASEFV